MGPFGDSASLGVQSWGDTPWSPPHGTASTCIQHLTHSVYSLISKIFQNIFFKKYHCMIINYLLILRFANQKLLWCMKTKRSPSHLWTSNRLCHLNTLQGMSHVNDNPQVSFPSSSSNIWSILCIIFSVAIPQGSDHRAQWSVHVRGRSWLQALAARCCPGHSQGTEPWWQEHDVPTRLCWVL